MQTNSAMIIMTFKYFLKIVIAQFRLHSSSIESGYRSRSNFAIRNSRNNSEVTRKTSNMVQCCSVKGCKSNSRKTPNVRFYVFPSEKNGTLRKQWLDTILRQNADGSPWQPKYFHKVCSRHFKDGRPTPQNPLPALNLSLDSDAVRFTFLT